LKKIFNLLEKYRLEKYYNAFLELGIEDERDFKDSVTKDNLNTLGFSQMEKNRFESLVDYLKQLGSSRDPEARPLIRKHLEDYYLKYRTPKSSETKIIRGLDPSQNTILDLILRMCHLENLEKDMTVCLFSHEGIPLTDDPFFNTWSLNDRNIENGSEIYAIFTLKQNVRHELQIDKGHFPASSGEDSIRCHIMLKKQEDYEIKVDLSNDSLKDLKMKLFAETGISPAVLHAK
uniref:Uncharacterized protein n=1 Tax=Lepisosteus oculatus TaxID=7918 RepID=W5LVK0_LEPOC